MRCVAVRQFKTPPQLLDLPTPSAGPGEVVVRVEAAAVNPLDWKIIDGVYEGRRRHLFPLIIGVDGAGTVAGADAGVRRFRVGDRVYGQFLHDPVGTGTYTEWTVVPESIGIGRIPDSWGAEDAAALPTAGMTALAALDRMGAGPSRIIAVVGAAGGVGSFALALGAAQGASMIGVSRAGSLERVRRLGARETVALDTEDAWSKLRTEYPQGVDGLIDVMHGRTDFDHWSGLVRPGGIAVSTIGAAGASAGTPDRPTLVNLSLEPTTDLLERLTDLMERFHLRAPVERRIKLEEAPEALAASRIGQLSGKTIIRVGA